MVKNVNKSMNMKIMEVMKIGQISDFWKLSINTILKMDMSQYFTK